MLNKSKRNTESDLLVVNNRELIDKLIERKEILQRLITKKEQDLKFAPEGKLHIAKRGKYRAFYVRKNPKDITGEYIKRDNIKLAYELAQAEYDNNSIKILKKDMERINEYIDDIKRINGLKLNNDEKNRMIVPIAISDEEYIKQWTGVEYEGKGFHDDNSEYYTANNERVRSKSEVMIADTLNRMKVPYRYEFPIVLKNGIKVYPDFYCLNVRKRKPVILEHFGMMDIADYVEGVMLKLNSYEKNGLKLGEDFIFTMENSVNPLSTKIIMEIINKYLV